MRSSRIAPHQENGTTKVVSFSFLNFFIFLLDKYVTSCYNAY